MWTQSLNQSPQTVSPKRNRVMRPQKTGFKINNRETEVQSELRERNSADQVTFGR